MVFIYVMQLENNKYYVGKTNTPSFRIENHFHSNGSAWTKLHRPMNVLELVQDCDNYDEDKITIKYMQKFGIENVRGGSFCQVTLPKETKNHIHSMIKGSNNLCFIWRIWSFCETM